MIENLQLGYLVIDTADVGVWSAFAERQLGLMVERQGPLAYARMDRCQQRLTFRPGAQDDVAVLGLLTSDDATLTELAARLRAAGTEVAEGSAAQCRERRVKRLVALQDPDGTPVEIATGAYQSVQPFGSAVVPGGFVTGRQGLGHAVLMTDDVEASLHFWCDLLGFTVSDTSGQETPDGESRAAFLHCNSRHHSIAVVQRPERSRYPRRLLHFMIEAAEMDSVGMAYDRALDAGLTINRSLGRHPNDRMFSFYATTPGGFDVEFGWGAVTVDDGWPAVHYDHISAWGHRKLARPA